MMNDRIMNGIDCIDDSLIEEAMNYRRTRKPIYFAAGAAAAVMLIGTGFLLGTNYMQQYIASYSPPTADGNAAQTEDEPSGAAPDEAEYASSTAPAGGMTPELTTVAPTGGGWDTGELCTAEVVPTGEPLTDAEATEYLESCGSRLAQCLLIEDGLPSEVMISRVGFCMVYAYGDRNEAYLTSKFFPVIVDGKIKALIELIKYEGELIDQGYFGGSKWDTINNAFSEHPGESFAFVRCGFLDELMIAPDGTAYQINYDSGAADRADFDLYSVYATEYNTFNLSEVIENGQYITVKF
ncbi:MAG: hypothetical protein IJT87_10360 [Ruminiclostridium sp.]|nr:hypothetical protein [Ruminiclostridium sp.]